MRKKKRNHNPDDSESPEQKAQRIALGLLARREHSGVELLRKLRQREIPDEVAAATIEGLKADKLQSETRFVEQFIRSRLEKGHGPQKIRAELQQRSMESELIEYELASLDVDWAALAETVRRKRFGPDLPADFQERAREARFLQGRGFRSEDIRKVLKGEIDDG